MKLITAFFAMGGLGLAQYSNTVFEQKFDHATAVGGSAAVRNIGQQYHQMIVEAFDLGGCNAALAIDGAIDVHLEASQDGGASWFVIGTRVTSIPAGAGTFVYQGATGAFPGVRIKIDTVTSACSLSAWYSGSVTGWPTSSAPNPTTNDIFNRTLAATTSNGNMQVNNCMVGVPAIYGLTVSTNTTTSATFTLGFAVSAGAAADNGLIAYAGGTRTDIWPQAARAYWVSTNTAKKAIVLNTSGLTGSVSLAVTYRCE